MSYTPPAGDAAHASWSGAGEYTPPAGGAADATWFVSGGGDGDPAGVVVTVLFDDEPVFSGSALYNNHLPRGASATARSPHQAAAPASTTARAPWLRTQARESVSRTPWQLAATRSATPAVRWSPTAPRERTARTPWQAAALADQMLRAAWEATAWRERSNTSGWQQADQRDLQLTARHQVAHGADMGLLLRHQVARPSAVVLQHRHRAGFLVSTTRLVRWQSARPPAPGLTIWVPPGTGEQPPREIVMDMVFACPPYTPGAPIALVFGRVCLPSGPPPALIVVPIRGRYMTLNTLLLRRVDGDIALKTSSVDLSIDHKSWTWSWSAGLDKSALALLSPEVGEPTEVELSINGTPYRLYSEEPERQRKFPRTRVSATGRGLACELDGDDVVQQYFSAAADRTAQQLANEALTVNGVGIGWAIDWQLTDWLVPGGVWSHQGTHISAVNAIAAAAGGYVQPHPTARTLRVLPGYPAAPWDWDGLVPDVELPAAPVTLEGIRWQSRPAYNRVFVSGDGGSTIWQVTRGGTFGDVDAPMVVDQLVTHVDAARQRGIAVLGDTGRQALVTLSLPVLQETGLILPGKLVRYVDGPTTRIGLVRSCAIEWRRPVLRQRISLETHI